MLLGIDWMDPNWLLDRFGTDAVLDQPGHRLRRVRAVLPDPARRHAAVRAGPLHRHRRQLDLFPGPPLVELLIAIAALIAAAFLGNVVGYEIGRRIGPPLYERDGRIVKRKYFDQTTAFFDRHGNKALVIGRFVPFVRTYITVVAGVTRMERHRFFLWSLVGAVLWVMSICLLGFFLGDAFPALGESIDKLVIVILAFSVIPIVFEWWRHKRTDAPGAEVGPHDGGPDRDITGSRRPGPRRRHRRRRLSRARRPARRGSAPSGPRAPRRPAGSRPRASGRSRTPRPPRRRRARAAPGRVADRAAGGDDVLDDRDPATGDVGALGELGGAVLLGLLAHEQRGQAGAALHHPVAIGMPPSSSPPSSSVPSGSRSTICAADRSSRAGCASKRYLSK